MDIQIAVIIPAAGSSERFNDSDSELLGPRSKLDEDLGGRPVLQRTIELFNTRPEVAAVIVAGPADDEAFTRFEFRHGDKITLLGATLCRGGADRTESVRNALKHIPTDATHVAIHDAARPVTPAGLIDHIFDLAKTHQAVIPVIECADTIKRIDPEPVADTPQDPADAILGLGSADQPSDLRRVEQTINRTNLVLAQTPQIFDRGLLSRAYAQPNLTSTDDAGLVERLGQQVITTPGDPANIKITRPADVPVARALAGFKPTAQRPSNKKF